MSSSDVPDFNAFSSDLPDDYDALIDTDRFLASMAQFMLEGQERTEVGLILQAGLEATEEWDRDFNEDVHILVLKFRGPRKVYEALDRSGANSSYEVFQRAADALKPDGYDYVRIERGVVLAGPVSSDWRNEMLAVLEGRDVDNQAVGFSAVTNWQGLRFRSNSEARIAAALDAIPGVMFLPNCRGRLGSKDRRRNLEADFIVMWGGVWGVLEVDGPHHEGKAAHDHDRDRPFHHHGAAIVQRYESLRCFREPETVVLEFMALLKKKARV